MYEWNVSIAVSGPIELPSNQLTMQVLKGEHRPFQTKVQLKKASHGVYLSVIAIADNPEEANDVAVFFVGRMLDLLSLKIDMPLYLSLFKPQFRVNEDHVRRIVTKHEWQQAFEISQRYGIARSTFCRAISWYRKGLVSEDPVDKLMAFWASLEAICSKYCEQNNRTTNGIINKICNCFDLMWGDVSQWKIIPNEPQLINTFCDKRNEIAHGTLPIVRVEIIKEIAELLPMLKQLCHEFLKDWDQNGKAIEDLHG